MSQQAKTSNEIFFAILLADSVGIPMSVDYPRQPSVISVGIPIGSTDGQP